MKSLRSKINRRQAKRRGSLQTVPWREGGKACKAGLKRKTFSFFSEIRINRERSDAILPIFIKFPILSTAGYRFQYLRGREYNYRFPFALLCVLHNIWQFDLSVAPPLLHAATWSASISSSLYILARCVALSEIAQ